MSFEPGKQYKITNAQGGTVIDLSGSDHKSIIGWPWHDGDNQKAGGLRFGGSSWILQQEPEDGGQWSLKSVETGQYLGFEGKPNDATRIVAVDQRQLWDIYPEDEDPASFRLWVRGTRLDLVLTDGNATPGTPLQLSAACTGQNQVWKFEKADMKGWCRVSLMAPVVMNVMVMVTVHEI
ncbi:ricin B lectin domain-containing protein [Lactifluus subvellereus]|nr:ricin B lectin domain-containing protein [Lactifluus subvellereus]